MYKNEIEILKKGKIAEFKANNFNLKSRIKNRDLIRVDPCINGIVPDNMIVFNFNNLIQAAFVLEVINNKYLILNDKTQDDFWIFKEDILGKIIKINKYKEKN